MPIEANESACVQPEDVSDVEEKGQGRQVLDPTARVVRDSRRLPRPEPDAPTDVRMH